MSNKFDNSAAWVATMVVTFFYFILGSIFMVMSGAFNIVLILIYSAVSSFLVVGWIFRDNASEAQIGSGMIFIVSSIIFLHTSAPIWGEEYYCQAQYSYRGNNTYSFKYGELTEGQDLRGNYEYCMSQGGFSYMMKRGEAQPTLLTLSSIATAISLLILIGSSVGQLNFNSSSIRKSSKAENKGIIFLEKELLECEKIVADIKKSKGSDGKKLPKSFYNKLMKLSDMLLYLSMYQSDIEYESREKRIDKLQKFASKKASETFKGDVKKIQQIRDNLSYSAGQGGYFSNELQDKWWKKY
jgi:hypothetical protein